MQNVPIRVIFQNPVTNAITMVHPVTHLPVKQPRNIKQVKNIRSHILGDFRLSHDGIF